jgi:hypothetical protein
VNVVIRIDWKLAVASAALLYAIQVPAQQRCTSGIHIEGTVMDPTGAVISGAQVEAADGQKTVTDTSGAFLLPCVPITAATITVQADGFTQGVTKVEERAGGNAHVRVQLPVAAVQTDVQAVDDATAMDADHGAGTRTMTAREVQQLADDPDDFQRQLQALAASGGGLPGSATIVVDGFQNASALPPKNSITSIRINPDMFSPEYERAPYLGGRVEILTKPGADLFHGALFFTDSDGSFNSTNPFSTTATPAGKRRYGFELNGPVVRKKSGFALALEKRDIDELSVVNAKGLDTAHNQIALQQTVAAPQRLWIASARNDWQITPNDVGTLSFSANNNSLGNQGVGGLTLAEGGYSSSVSEYNLRLSNVLTLSPNLLHETRIGYTWKRTAQTPNSLDPSLQVLGYFSGGGATSQNLNNRERDLEIDDDVMLTRGKHSFKIGAQSLGIFVHDYDPDTFNGAYVFGGGSAPMLDSGGNPTGQTTTISPIEQYRRARSNLAGGSPTTYQLTSGTPLVPLTQWRLSLYAQDAIKLAPRLSFATGLRYQLQTTPGSFTNFSPRLGIAWSPDKKSTWVVHIRAGIFHDPNLQSAATEVHRLNGSRQQALTVYSPSFSSPLTPVAGSTQVHTVKQFPNSLNQSSSLQTHVSVEHTFPRGWHAATTLFWADNWGSLRTKNINAPLVGSSIGTPPDPITALLAPRPIAPNENILQYQNSGHLSGTILVAGGDHNNGKRFGISAYYVHVDLKTNTSNSISSPQSSYSEQGESSRSDGTSLNSIYASGSLHLPYKLDLSAILDALSGQPYNVTTGTDANGDGNFNDRPSYASAPGSGVYPTRFGLLTTNTVNGDISRNLGTMPARVHLDMNLTRAFKLNPKDKEHPRTLTLNARSANFLNHTNVTAVGTVVSSSTFSQPLSAETARRIELGARFTF